MFKKILLLLNIFLFFSSLSAQQVTLSPQAEISILTNSPANVAVYKLWGHAAIRVKDSVNVIDKVYNYGIFSFNQPDFIYRFVKGETYYQVMAMSFSNYSDEYQYFGQSIDEQVLNLSPGEKQRIYEALEINCLPENRTYLYNFFFDNCSTRPFDMVVNHLDKGSRVILPQMQTQTFRQMTDEMLQGYPWTRFGVNILVGRDADRETDVRQMLFLPKYLHLTLQNTLIENSSQTHITLIGEERQLLTPIQFAEEETNIWSPMVVSLLVLALALLLSAIEWKKKKALIIGRIFDTLLFSIYGLAGVVLTFLMFFSIHPCMLPNWNYVWLNPLHLVAATLFFIKKRPDFLRYYHFFNFAVLLAFFLLAEWCLPQTFEWAFYPFVATLMLRSGMFFRTSKKVIN